MKAFRTLLPFLLLGFASPALGAGHRWSHTFEKLGMFPYHIGEHPNAKGKVIVE